MSEKEMRELINQTVNATIARLKAAGLMKQDGRTAREKTEELLRQYPFFKLIKGKKRTERLVESVDKALNYISNDTYCDIIRRYYFEKESREAIALDYGVNPATISRNKDRLVGILAAQLFSDETINELFNE